MMSEEQIVHELAQIAQKKAVRQRRRKTARLPAKKSTAPAIKLSPTQLSGRRAEQQAKCYLETAGLTVIGQNLRSKTGEIDLVCLDRATLVFVEVRHRHSNRHGGAAASVNRVKQQRLIRTAHFFLPGLTRRHFHGAVPACRFDVIAVEPAGIVWLKHAFSLA
jgi:putative endonuclease